MKLPRGALEDYILIAIFIIGILLALFILTSCATKQTAVKLEYTDGCRFMIEGISNKQAASMEKEWSMKPPCTINSYEDIEANKKQGPPE